MNLPMDSLKKYTNFDRSLMQPGNVTNADLSNSLNAALTAIVMTMGLFTIVAHKKRSVDYPHPLKGHEEKIDKIQEHLDQALEKWGNINNMRP